MIKIESNRSRMKIYNLDVQRIKEMPRLNASHEKN